jgi:crotonobetainyl-CoA:carnitine CoA-transferase CaiB-like acyl-CoA transferase
VGRFLAGHLADRTNGEWLALLDAADIPACAVNSIEDLLADEHLKAVNFFETLEHPTEGTVRNCRFPILFSRSPVSVQRLAPNLGEHNAEVFPVQPDRTLP